MSLVNVVLAAVICRLVVVSMNSHEGQRRRKKRFYLAHSRTIHQLDIEDSV